MPVDVVERHVAHQKDETYPWHIGRVYSGCDEIGSTSADEDGPEASPHVEEANQVEHGDAFCN